MQVACPKCNGAMVIVPKSLSDSVLPVPYTPIKNFLPSELKKYDSLEIRVCQNCGYCEIYWK
jgi:predicted nucleic-acid-binding Zn-ribbon protein